MPHTVLIVDDEEAIRTAWRKALELADYHVLTAANAKQALELCDEHAINVVVLDFIMPSMDGLRLLVEIRKRQPFVRSLVVSGKLDSDISQADLTAELKAGVEADVYLHKPVSNDDLRGAIERLQKSEPTADWKSVAEQATRVRKVTAKKAAGVAKSLKGRKKT